MNDAQLGDKTIVGSSVHSSLRYTSVHTHASRRSWRVAGSTHRQRLRAITYSTVKKHTLWPHGM